MGYVEPDDDIVDYEEYGDEDDFKIQKLSDKIYIVGSADTIIFEKPYIKYFTGEVNNKNAQLRINYFLSSLEELEGQYLKTVYLYVDGNDKIYYFSLKNKKGLSAVNITYDDNIVGAECLYDVEY
ncbi:MAG: hypothetical protein LBL90_10865 [Prevotellaceae bacterium]|jgi:hypothetical protein|nr:hypothetical protein [Prevotellaceae bacterium]